MKPYITRLNLLFVLVLSLAMTVSAVYFVRQSQQNTSRWQAPLRTSKAMVWKATRGEGVLWICGSNHLLSTTDYPLPEPYMKALEQAKAVVMELLPNSTKQSKIREQMEAASRLLEGQRLESILSPPVWQSLSGWCDRSGVQQSLVQTMKPWMAALTIAITAQQRLGYSAAHGLERYFGERIGNRAIHGLETVEGQLSAFDNIPMITQEKMIQQAIVEAEAGGERARELTSAWREGDSMKLGAMMQESFKDFQEIRQLLVDDRNRAWLPKLLGFLDSGEPTMVIVGAGHLAGDGNILDLLRAKGVTLEQQMYSTTRLPQ